MNREEIFGVLNNAMNRVEHIEEEEIGNKAKILLILRAAVNEVLDGLQDIQDEYSLPDEIELEYEDDSFVSD